MRGKDQEKNEDGTHEILGRAITYYHRFDFDLFGY